LLIAVRLHSDLKIVTPDLSCSVNMTVQIDGGICDVKFNVPVFTFLRVRLALPDGRE
jgi:hypothetical protein